MLRPFDIISNKPLCPVPTPFLMILPEVKDSIQHSVFRNWDRIAIHGRHDQSSGPAHRPVPSKSPLPFSFSIARCAHQWTQMGRPYQYLSLGHGRRKSWLYARMYLTKIGLLYMACGEVFARAASRTRSTIMC
ncbi:hypothetical protein BDR03DRAFT_505879 [Suillus americanus]|nr:hypothetical protein BDR03DRAFT_505879 [Suillus americanus]